MKINKKDSSIVGKMKFSDKAVVYMGSNFIGSFLLIVRGMVMVRYLTKFDYGTFRQITLISVLISSTLAIGLPQSLSYFIPLADTPREKKQLAFQVFTLLTLLGLIAATLTFLFRSQVSSGFNNPAIFHYAWIFSLFFLFLLPSKCTQATLISLGKTNYASLLNTATDIFDFFFIIIPLLLGQGLKVILISMLLVYILKFLVVIFVLSSLDGGLPKILHFASIKAQIVYAFPLAVSIMVGVSRRYVDQFIIATCYDPENFAIYSRGAFQLPLVSLLPHTLSTLLVPKITEYYKNGKLSNILHLWHESMWKVALIFFPLFVYTFIFAEKIITLLFTANYLGSTPIFRIYLLLLPFRITAFRTILLAIGKTKAILIAVNISFVISIVLGVISERAFGFIGPAFGIVIGELASMSYMIWQTKTHMRISFLDLIPLKRLVRPMLCAVIVGVIIYPIKFINLSDLLIIVTSGLLYFSFYLLIIKIFNVMTDDDWDFICRWASLKIMR